MTWVHAVEMAGAMRPADRREYDAMMRDEPALGLEKLRRKSREAWAAFVDGDLAVVYGLVVPTILSHEAHPWLLATDVVERPAVRRAFARRSRAEAARLMQGFDRYSNWCDVENGEAMRWLFWLGFTFASETRQHNGVEFVHFWKDS
jgi:hypothetical protein